MTSRSPTIDINMIEQPLMNGVQDDRVFIEKILKDWENDKWLEVVRLDSEPACKVGDNYMSAVTRVHVRGQSGDRESFKRTLLVKRQLSNVIWCEVFRCDAAFKNEAAAYREVLPAFRDFANSISLPFPSCLHASSKLLILQDLQPLGYQMENRQRGLDLAQTTMALQALAKFHSISLAMKVVEPKKFQNIKSSINELVFVPEVGSYFSPSLEHGLQMALRSLRTHGESVLDEAVQQLQTLKGKVFDVMQKLVTPKEPLSVICHGDFWINNMLFKYDADSSNVLDVMFVDLQVCRYAPLTTDILHLLYTSTSPGVTQEYLEELVESYHKALIENLKCLAPDMEMPTLIQLQDSIEDHALYGLLISFLILPAITIPQDNLLCIENIELSMKEIRSRTADSLTQVYRQKVRDLVREFLSRSFI